jgi:hypothetical protein
MSIYLVTGGAGFIGSHLCDALVARGDSVRVLDDLSTGRRSNLPVSATLIEGDVGDPALALLALDGVDGCFHLAAIASVEKGVTDWLGTHHPTLPAPFRCSMPSGGWAAKSRWCMPPPPPFTVTLPRSRLLKGNLARRCQPMALTSIAASCKPG